MKKRMVLASLLGASLFLNGCVGADDANSDNKVEDTGKEDMKNEEEDATTSATYREYTDISELEINMMSLLLVLVELDYQLQSKLKMLVLTQLSLK